MKWAEMGTRMRDRLIAEKVMGYSVRADGCYDGGFAHATRDLVPAYYLFDEQGKTDWRMERPTQEGAWDTCRQYTTSMDAAWLAVEKLKSEKWFDNVELVYLKRNQRRDTEYIRVNFCFRNVTNAGKGPWNHYYAEAATAPEAICLAALRAVGIEIEE